MKGHQLTFFTQQDRRYAGKPVAEWLLETARELGVRGATAFVGSEGFGHSRRFHSAHFFELADQPVEVTMAVTDEESKQLFARLEKEKIQLFYVKTPVEFGTIGSDDT